MKNGTNQGFDQDYNAQVAVDQTSLLIVGESLSNHPNDQHEAAPTLDAIPPALGTPDAAALDTGYFSAANIAACERRAIDPYSATGRDPHHPSWWERFADLPTPPEDASPKVKMAYKRNTVIGQAIYRAEMYGRAGDWDYKRYPGLSPVLAARRARRRRRMVSGVPGVQFEAVAYPAPRIAAHWQSDRGYTGARQARPGDRPVPKSASI